MRENDAATRTTTFAPLARLLSLALVASGAGCRPAPVEKAPVVERPAPVAATRVYVEAQLVTGCEVSDRSEFYPFDAFVWENPNGDALKDLAHCLARGPFKGRKVRLVEHDTPDASGRYETKYKKSRAAMVREYLVFHGVEPAAVVVQAEDEALPTASSPDGRRVELELIPETDPGLVNDTAASP